MNQGPKLPMPFSPEAIAYKLRREAAREPVVPCGDCGATVFVVTREDGTRGCRDERACRLRVKDGRVRAFGGKLLP